MLTKFTCPLNQDYIEILDYEPPEPGVSKMYPALINDSQLVVMKMSGVADDNLVENDSSTSLLKINKLKLNLCDGVLETELPLGSYLSGFDIYKKIFIEKIGEQVVYRSRNCPLFMTILRKCQYCLDLLNF